MEIGQYAGIYPESGIPKRCCHRELSHIGRKNGKPVKYFHVWIREPKGTEYFFEEPNPKRLSVLERFLRWLNE